jgi:hypothetical protein
MHRLKFSIFTFLLLLSQALIAPSCQTSRGEIIPYVKVDEYFLIYADLADLGVLGYKFVPGGVNGLVIYQESQNDYRAYDRTCTMWPEHNKAVVDDTLALVCPECKSLYIPSLGAMPDSKSGPAVHALIEYQAVLSGDVLHVFN